MVNTTLDYWTLTAITLGVFGIGLIIVMILINKNY